MIIHKLVDLLFPTFCKTCNEKTNLRYLCEGCWLESSLLDPSYRCRFCFQELDAPDVCHACKKVKTPIEKACLFERNAPVLSLLHKEEATEAAAGFILYQLLTLNWQKPTIIASLPSSKNPIARFLAELLQVPYRPIFRKRVWPLGAEHWEVKEHEIEDDFTILVLDFQCPKHQLRAALRSLSCAFIKKVYLLSLST